ncbi:hypothetical protein D3C72_1763360 [compost metagenome]
MPGANWVATSLSGATLFSTQASSAASRSIDSGSVPEPSRLWPTEGEVSKRAKPCTLLAPSCCLTESKYSAVRYSDTQVSDTPYQISSLPPLSANAPRPGSVPSIICASRRYWAG